MSEETKPTHEQIQRRASELYLERGGEDGSHEDDWFAAEQELSELKSDEVAPSEESASRSAPKAQLGAQTENRAPSRERQKTSVGFPSPVSSAP